MPPPARRAMLMPRRKSAALVLPRARAMARFANSCWLAVFAIIARFSMICRYFLFSADAAGAISAFILLSVRQLSFTPRRAEDYAPVSRWFQAAFAILNSRHIYVAIAFSINISRQPLIFDGAMPPFSFTT
jgi:hypothetical protein